MLDTAEIAGRAAHVLRVLFTAFTAVGTVAAVAVWVARGASARTHERVVLVASLAVLAWFATPVVTALVVGWLLAVYLAVEEIPPPLSMPLVVGLLGLLVVAPIVAIGRLDGGHVREFVAFGTNMVLLRAWGYAWDRRHERAPRPPLASYLVAMLFFPTFVNGPVEVPRQMDGGWLPLGPGTRGREAGAGRVVKGVVKLFAVGVALPLGWNGVLAELGDASALRLWGMSAFLYVWFYISFSAWSDVAIGLGRLCGRRVPENFAAPWLATDPADFWRRWHVSFGLWLRDYVYIPLGGNRRRREWNVLVTFLASAAWHVWGTLKLLGFGYYPVKAWAGFFIWGLLHTAGVLASPRLARATGGAGSARVAAARVATFLFAAFCWLPFFLPGSVPLRRALRMLARMLFPWV